LTLNKQTSTLPTAFRSAFNACRLLRKYVKSNDAALAFASKRVDIVHVPGWKKDQLAGFRQQTPGRWKTVVDRRLNGVEELDIALRLRFFFRNMHVKHSTHHVSMSGMKMRPLPISGLQYIGPSVWPGFISAACSPNTSSR